AVSTTAQEAKNPKRDLPIGILASLVICTILYILISLVLTGVVNYKQLNVAAPMGVGIDKIVELRSWSPAVGSFLSSAVKIGAISGLTSVILVMMLGQTRIFYAMSKDGLLPWFNKAHPKHGTPHTATILTGLFVAICGGLMPLGLVGELVSIGTLLAFLLVCIGVPILRITNPHVERPFKVPAPWVIGLIGAGFCAWLMFNLPHDTWIRLMLWMEAGLLIYACYGWRHSKMASESAERKSINMTLVRVAVLTLIPTLIWAYLTFGRA
ncbi:MAG: APC family permease, partial [Holophagaceae bacterium]